jgi:ribosomal protein S18 acetylase RimI-like enzyme
MSLTVRPVSDDDLESLVDLTLRAFVPIFDSFEAILGPAIYSHIWPDWMTSQQEAVEMMCSDRDRYTVLAAELDGGAVGYVAYTLDEKSRTGEIQLIAVDPEHQNDGIATALCNKAVEEMTARGMTFARVETGGDLSHAPARRAYEKAGFTGLPLVRYFMNLG